VAFQSYCDTCDLGVRHPYDPKYLHLKDGYARSKDYLKKSSGISELES